MRINAEKERIQRFKQISQGTASQYYKILDRFSNLLINTKAAEVLQEQGIDSTKADLQNLILITFKETQLHNTLKFICEYFKRINENGHTYTSDHFFILLLELTADDVKNMLAPYLKTLI
jgi:hypothetical protein